MIAGARRRCPPSFTAWIAATVAAATAPAAAARPAAPRAATAASPAPSPAPSATASAASPAAASATSPAAASATSPAAPSAPAIDADAALAAALAHFRRADFAAALPLLERAAALDASDGDARLLLGITRFRLQRLDAAAAALRPLAHDADRDRAAAARVFLALIANARGDTDSMPALLADTRATALEAPAAGLLRASRPRHVTLLLVVRPEYDSNVALQPLTPTASAASLHADDGDVLGIGAITVRPWPRLGLWLDDTAAYRQQLTRRDFDLFANVASAGYAYRGDHDRVSLGYGFETTTLGGSLLDLGHRAHASYRRRLFGELGIAVQYQFYYRDYRAPAYQAFTGASHHGAVELGWGTPDRGWDARVAYVIVREALAAPTFSALGHGVRLGGHVRFARRWELSGEAWAIARGFDAADPALGARRDVQLYADLALAVDVGGHVSLLAGGSALRNLSSLGSFDYLKLTASLGVAVAWAGP